MRLSIVVPFYNEHKTIVTVLENLSRVDWPAFVEHLEIICVDDASTDNGSELVEAYVQDKENVRLVNMEKNSGKGAAVRRGFEEEAKGDVFFIQDADLELFPSDIPSMLNAMHSLGVEFVNGSRYKPNLF